MRHVGCLQHGSVPEGQKGKIKKLAKGTNLSFNSPHEGAALEAGRYPATYFQVLADVAPHVCTRCG